MSTQDSVAYGLAADKLWKAYQTMDARQKATDDQRTGAMLMVDASAEVSPKMWAVIDKLDRAYTRRRHAVARLFRAYMRTFEVAPYHNSTQSDVTVPDRTNTHASVAAIDAALTAGERLHDATRDQSHDMPATDAYVYVAPDMPLSAGMVGF